VKLEGHQFGMNIKSWRCLWHNMGQHIAPSHAP